MKIYINPQHTISGDSTKTIFESAKLNGLTLNHSCLKGRCSECKVQIVKGQYYMPDNQEGLTDKEVDQGYCLSCITTPKSDLILYNVNFFEGILPQAITIPAKIHKLEFLTEEVVKVTLRTPPSNQFKFLAGQYVDLSFNNIKRSYSIASRPSDPHLEFFIKKYPNGEFSNYLFNDARLNDLLRIEGPKGTYIIPQKLEKTLVFLSTGTGIAPNLAMIKFGLETNLFKPEQVMLIHGQRRISEHIYNLQEELDNIRIIQVTSQDNESGFFNGYVQDALLNENLDLSTTQVFACGSKEMISNSKNLLINKGLSPSNFKSDIFSKTN